MKRWISLMMAVMLVLCMLPAAAGAAATTTVMMYMCGTDLQEDCVTDIYEMCEADLGSNIRIVILAGGASQWADSDLKANRLNLFTIEDHGFSAVTDWGNASMGSEATLEKFVSYCWKNYRSDRNMLVLWNHGGGAADGVCFDEVHNGDGLNMSEINAALYNVYASDQNFHLDILGCDACLMGAYEMAVLASYYADYYIASEELEPFTGWYYTPWLNALARDPGMSNEKLGKKIVDAYAEGVMEAGVVEYTTLSLISCQSLQSLRGDMELLASYLEQALENGQLAAIKRSMSRMYRFGTYYSTDGTWDMFDLGDVLDICEQFAPNTTSDARRHLSQAVAYSYDSGDVPRASGLSIYLPNKSSSYFRSDCLDGYAVGDYNANYVDFVLGLSTMMSGGNYSFQASTPAYSDVSTVGSTSFVFTTAAYGFVPGGTYNAEQSGGSTQPAQSSTSGQGGGIWGLLPGGSDAEQSSEPSGSAQESTPSQSGGIWGLLPGGSSAEQSTEPAAAQPAQGSSIWGFLPGSASQAETVAPAQDDKAFTLQLTAEDMDNLDYAEGALFMELSDDDIFCLLDLGYMRNTWIDWNSNTICSTFDGTWPTLDGQLVVLYDQAQTAVSRRSLIPVTVNGEETYLVVSFDGDSTQGRILGYNEGVDANGLPVRKVHPLQEGDVIIPLYTLLYCSWDDIDNDDDLLEETFEGDPISWTSDLQVVYLDISDEEEPTDYQFAFYLNDIFGEYEVSDFFDFSM